MATMNEMDERLGLSADLADLADLESAEDFFDYFNIDYHYCPVV